eukprot:6016065-Pyramimonas_sp.AAC.1
MNDGMPDLGTDGHGSRMLSRAAERLQKDMCLIPRTLACVEVFAGSARITRSLISKGYRACSVERDRFGWQDCCSLIGTLYVMFLVAAILPAGALWLSPQCSTWLNLCMYHTRRSIDDPLGDCSRLDVREGNYVASLTSA